VEDATAWPDTLVFSVLMLQEFDVEKHWWGWRIASLGYRVIYMDSDAVVLRNPLLPFEAGYDVQVNEWPNALHSSNPIFTPLY